MEKDKKLENFGESDPAKFCRQLFPKWNKLNLDKIFVENKSGESVSGNDYYVVNWEGEKCGVRYEMLSDQKLVKELALFITKMHKLPNEWYQPFRENLNKRFPNFKDLPEGSFFWWHAPSGKLIDFYNYEKYFKEWFNAGPRCTFSEAGKRLVTSTFDVHSMNFINTNDGIKIIDFDWARVNMAVIDFFTVFNTLMKNKSIGEKRFFITTYLEASELPASEVDVDALILDAELGEVEMISRLKPYVFEEIKSSKLYQNLFIDFINLVSKNKDLAKEIVCKGISNCQQYVYLREELFKVLLVKKKKAKNPAKDVKNKNDDTGKGDLKAKKPITKIENDNNNNYYLFLNI